jgi:hypothetical protein
MIDPEADKGRDPKHQRHISNLELHESSDDFVTLSRAQFEEIKKELTVRFLCKLHFHCIESCCLSRTAFKMLRTHR